MRCFVNRFQLYGLKVIVIIKSNQKEIRIKKKKDLLFVTVPEAVWVISGHVAPLSSV